MKRLQLNVLGLSEVRWTGAASFATGDYTLVYSGGDQHERGVGMLLDEQTSKSIKGYWAVSDRVLLMKLYGKPFNISIIQAYAPTANYDDDSITDFYEDLDKAYKQCNSNDIVYVMGDFNAKVGNERVGNTVGPFGLGAKNERGDNLIAWCQSHNLVITNTWFKNHPRRLWTWKSPGDPMIELHDLSSDESFDDMKSSDTSYSSPKTGAASNKSSSNSTMYDSPRVSDIILVRAAAYHGINQLQTFSNIFLIN
ncbi:unnamed protein product [Adineta ricciae]|uniref:Endonuclease/exonuclease/phosphatase domain-containing protein n=1 Tax=Adineta ricciae TaxID=249248 RepID=A0A815VVL0_ADIRI|nr:unnamed protein product [Adineta ricciae]